MDKYRGGHSFCVYGKDTESLGVILRGRRDRLGRESVTVSCRPVKYPDTHGSSCKSAAFRATLFSSCRKYFPRAGKKGKTRDRYLKGS